ncbi:MAG: family 78 glycoside hydrolase catalytic domain, partial [Spirochaetales bacterium]|nr:family 78 glycoside hydrolase catalytic domain [Spirochaetales bacterium]
WECCPHPGCGEAVVKMSNGLGYGEVYRADLAADESLWNWKPPVDRGPALSDKRKITVRDIPDLEENLISPAGLRGSRAIETAGFVRSVSLRSLVYPGDHDINKHKRFSGILETAINSPRGGSARIGLTLDPHDTEALVFFVGDRRLTHINGETFPVELPEGITSVRVLLKGEYHDPLIHFKLILPEDSSLVSPDGGDKVFQFHGPVGATHHLQVCDPIPPAADEVLSEEELLYPGTEWRKQTGKQLVPDECVSVHHVAMDCLTAAAREIPDSKFYIQVETEASDFPLTLNWGPGERRQILLDFGREVSGFLEFELDCPEGTRIDFFCYESMHDGLIEHAWSLNNSLRYFSSEGDQKFTSFLRRGFRYISLVFDSYHDPGPGRESDSVPGTSGRALLKGIRVRERLYPASGGSFFRCSDEQLNRIWEISARTVSLCMEDTYVDCPAYEQTYWTGDARNTALYSYYLYNAGPLFLRGARLAGRSLERSPLIESTIPSAWQNVIPAWSFFHVLAGAEYLFYTGDEKGFDEIYPSLYRNMENAADRRVTMPDGSGLFALHAWNMLDWAPMDVPDDGIIAHQNAEFVLACRSLAETAEQRGHRDDAVRLTRWADEVSAAVLMWFRDEEKSAFRDSISRDFVPSETFSVQTQMMIYLAGIVEDGEALRKLILNPPADFVTVGSPFNHHFLLDLYYRWGMYNEVLLDIRKTWGHMLDNGATSCWEGWELIPGHHTRSHCHAWSAAPAYFLPSILLGIRPEGRSFSRVRIAPVPGDLTSAEGSLVTPHGVLDIFWTAGEGIFNLEVESPEGIKVLCDIPEGYKAGKILINGQLQ